MKILCLNLSDFQKLVLLIVFLLSFFSGTAFATVYTVNNTADGTGLNQLRGALLSAGSTAGTHTINVGAGTYYIDNDFIGIGTVNNCDITINGAGIGITIIDPRQQSRAFALNPENNRTGVKISFNGMTIQNCASFSSTGGGAVAAAGGAGNAYSFNNCLFFNNGSYYHNTNAQPEGGAIYCRDASLSITNCSFSSNKANVSAGGAISFRFTLGSRGNLSGQLNITNSRFSFNTAARGGGGGALFVVLNGFGSGFSTSVTECTFTSNSLPEGFGGAIWFATQLDGSPLNINYNRFSGNTAMGQGAVSIRYSKLIDNEFIYPPNDLLNAKNNWWGCNEGAAGCDDFGWSANGFAEIFTPHLQLKTTLSAPSICYGTTNSAQITTGFTSNSANEPITPSNLDALIGRPVSFIIPGSMGNLTALQSTIQATGTVTANFNSNGTPGVVDIYAHSDNASNTASLSINAPGTWQGTASSDWFLPGNWCGTAIPTVTTNVLIPAGTPNPAVIKEFQSAFAKNLTIASGASLSLDAYASIDLKGDFTNNGTFSASAEGALTLFSGAGTQTIPGGTYSMLGISGGDKTLSADATLIHYFLFLDNTKMLLGNNTFTVVSPLPFNDFNSARYFVTNGTGGLKKNNLGSQVFTFPIGTETSYTPVTLTNAGATDNFTARVGDGVYESYLNDVPVGSPLTSKAVNKTWYISEDIPGGSNAGIALYWNLADELASFDRTACFVSHYKSTSWNSATAGVASGGGPFSRSRSGITSFSPFAVANPGSALPVTLARFDATGEGNTALISWSTTYETNSDRFEVERSVNGKSWEMIGSVKSSGESRQLIDYHFVDLHPVYSQENLYRLRMVDIDGTFAYSRIRNLYFEGSDTQIAYPNPATDKLFVQDFTQVSSLQMIDMNGKVIHQSNGMSISGIHVGKFSAGLHLLEISWKDGRKTTQKVLINR